MGLPSVARQITRLRRQLSFQRKSPFPLGGVGHLPLVPLPLVLFPVERRVQRRYQLFLPRGTLRVFNLSFSFPFSLSRRHRPFHLDSFEPLSLFFLDSVELVPLISFGSFDLLPSLFVHQPRLPPPPLFLHLLSLTRQLLLQGFNLNEELLHLTVGDSHCGGGAAHLRANASVATLVQFKLVFAVFLLYFVVLLLFIVTASRRRPRLPLCYTRHRFVHTPCIGIHDVLIHRRSGSRECPR